MNILPVFHVSPFMFPAIFLILSNEIQCFTNGFTHSSQAKWDGYWIRSSKNDIKSGSESYLMHAPRTPLRNKKQITLLKLLNLFKYYFKHKKLNSLPP